MNEPIWITKEIILAIQTELVARFGGIQGVRDEGLLESALARPQQLFHYGEPTVVITEVRDGQRKKIAEPQGRGKPSRWQQVELDALLQSPAYTPRLATTKHGIVQPIPPNRRNAPQRSTP